VSPDNGGPTIPITDIRLDLIERIRAVCVSQSRPVASG
jgi:hypothetical protein